MYLDTEKRFTVCYNDIPEVHSCGSIRMNDGQEVGRFSGNIFDGYRAIVKTDGHRTYIEAAHERHLLRLLAGYFVSNGLFSKANSNNPKTSNDYGKDN